MPRGEFNREDRRERTRARLLEAAAAVYGEWGTERATLEMVATEAGFTKGAIYDHFGSKENLLFALLDEYLTGQIAEQMTLFETAGSVTERPQIGADIWLDHLGENPDPFRLFVEAWVIGQRDPVTGEKVAQGIDAWRAMFHEFGSERARELGEPPNEALLAAHGQLMVALGLGFAMLKLNDPDTVPSGLLGAAYRVLLGAIEANPEARALIETAVAGRTTPAAPPRS